MHAQKWDHPGTKHSQDAWPALDLTVAQRTKENRETAVSFAAYQAIINLFPGAQPVVLDFLKVNYFLPRGVIDLQGSYLLCSPVLAQHRL
jgi:hypothetical protein